MIRIYIVVFAVCLFSFSKSKAQDRSDNPYPDTLVVNTESKKELTFAFRDIQNEKPDLNNELWRSILGIMESSLESSTKDEGVMISYSKVTINGEERARIEVVEFEERSDIFWIGKEGMRHDAAYRVVFEITQPKVKITFSLNSPDELDQIKEINIESIWNSEIEKGDAKRVLYNGKGSIELGVLHVDEINHSNPTDFLEFRAGVGVGFYRDRFIPDISYDVSLNFRDRFGKPRTKVGILYTQHYMLSEQSEGDFDLHLNGFLNAYWTIFKGTNREYGIGFGYLINQNGGFYEGSTFKMSVYNKRSSRTSLTPELVFTNGFKQSFPALRFGLSF